MDLLRVKLYVLFKSLVLIYSVGLVNSVYLQPNKVLYYNTNFFYKGRYWGYSFGLNKPSVPYIEL